jgi:hypothetical protein
MIDERTLEKFERRAIATGVIQ